MTRLFHLALACLLITMLTLLVAGQWTALFGVCAALMLTLAARARGLVRAELAVVGAAMALVTWSHLFGLGPLVFVPPVAFICGAVIHVVERRRAGANLLS